ncbi:hypothetical protein SEUCBS139899_010375 [Sporothrix eucalyptigena]
MHYVRLLRPPNVVKAPSSSRPDQKSGSSSLGLVLTITTDLGESFLWPDSPVGLAVELLIETVERQCDGEGGDDAESDSDGNEDEVEKPLPKETVKTNVFKLPLAAPSQAPAAKAGKPGKPPKAVVGSSDALSWNGGMRVLKLEAKLPKEAESLLWSSPSSSSSSTGKNLKRRICIRTADKSLSATHIQHLTKPKSAGNGDEGGLIMPLWVDVPATADEAFPHVALRQLLLHDEVLKMDSTTPEACVEVEEEIGESIARHVWDAGLVAVTFLADTCLGQSTSRKRPREEDGDNKADTTTPISLPDALRSILLHQPKQAKDKTLRVLEVGSGVGILGIGLAAIVQEAGRRSTATTDDDNAMFLLTDLPEAEEHARANIARSGLSSLEYENLDWEDGRQGHFGPAVAGKGDDAGTVWDLVVLSDCTYNVDMLPALVETLTALPSSTTKGTKAKKPSVLLARKPRHASEEALFSLMTEHGWTVRASSEVPLPVLDNDAQVVELYLYEKA